MFNRIELKEQAKALLKDKFLILFLGCLIYSILSGDIVSIKHNSEFHTATITLFSTIEFVINYYLALGLAIFVGVFSILWTIFIAGPVQIGAARFFTNSSLKQEKLDDLLAPFRFDYMHNVAVIFHRNVIVFLWALLLLIPGIIKSYTYRFVPFLVNDNPTLSSQEILDLSSEMTSGLKMEMFILDLSFFLWHLLAGFLSVITLGLSDIAVRTYTMQTDAQLYYWVLKNKEFKNMGHLD